jgi:hypothetical protein
MSSKNTTHISFASTIEFSDNPRILSGNSIIISATLQGPRKDEIPGLDIVDFLPVDIEYYNEGNETFSRGLVAICIGTISFRDQTASSISLYVKASSINWYVFIVTILFHAFLLTLELQLPRKSSP